jgi:hypothetical protein
MEATTRPPVWSRTTGGAGSTSTVPAGSMEKKVTAESSAAVAKRSSPTDH